MSSPAVVPILTEQELKLMLASGEHDFVERKPLKQKGDWLQTAVAFANSTQPNYPAVLFVGVDDDGKPQGSQNTEDLAKSVSGVLGQAYPPIYHYSVPLHLHDGDCLAVVIPGSETRPHFAGKAFIRDGPQTKEASAEQFSLLVAQRVSKFYELSRWVGKTIVVARYTPPLTPQDRIATIGTGWTEQRVIFIDCNQFYASFCDPDRASDRQARWALPLSQIDISFDYKADTLRLEAIKK